MNPQRPSILTPATPLRNIRERARDFSKTNGILIAPRWSTKPHRSSRHTATSPSLKSPHFWNSAGITNFPVRSMKPKVSPSIDADAMPSEKWLAIRNLGSITHLPEWSINPQSMEHTPSLNSEIPRNRQGMAKSPVQSRNPDFPSVSTTEAVPSKQKDPATYDGCTTTWP